MMDKFSDWYTVFVFDGREQTVVLRLRKLFDDNFLQPLEQDDIRHFSYTVELTDPVSGKKSKKKKNLYPGIVLLRTENMTEKMRAIMSGISYVLRASEFPLTEPEHKRMIDTYEKAVRDSFWETLYHDEERSTGDYLKPGDNVRIMYGAFDGCSATVQESIDSHKMKVLVNVFGRDTPIEIDPNLLEIIR